MSLSKFNWIIVYDNGKVVKVYTDYPDYALQIATQNTQDPQPLALVRGDYWKADSDAIIDGD